MIRGGRFPGLVTLLLPAALVPVLLCTAPRSPAEDDPLGNAVPRLVRACPETWHDVSSPLHSAGPSPDEDEAAPGPTSGGSTSGEALTAERTLGPVERLTSAAVEQTSPGTKAAPEVVASFDGLGEGFTGPQGAATSRNPSDNSLAVGPDHIVQTVNARMAMMRDAKLTAQ
jgi:hypothetical protein